MGLPLVSEVARPQAWGYDASLANILLRLVPTAQLEMNLATAAVQAQRIQTEQTSEDFVSEYGIVFSRNDFSGGEGLDFAHKTRGSAQDVSRYWDSRGVDVTYSPRGELAAIRMLLDTEQLWADSDTNPYLCQIPDGTVFYAATSTVWKVTNIFATESRSSEDPNGAGTEAVTGLCSLGDEVFAGLGTDTIAKRSSGGSWALLGSATNCDGIWSAKQRILQDNAGQLNEIDLASGAPTAVGSPLGSGHSYTSVTDAGSVILAAATDGYIYIFREESGSLVQRAESRITTVDVPYTVWYQAGVVFIGTGQATPEGGKIGRLYRALVSGDQTDFALTDVQLIRTWEGTATQDYTPYAAASSRDSFYTAVDDGVELTLWRYQLPTAGLSRDRIFDADGRCYGIVVQGDKIAVTMDAEGLWAETSTYATGGWLITPAADHFSASDKQWIDCRVAVANVGALAPIAVYYSTDVDALLDSDHASWTILQNITSLVASNEPIPFTDVQTRWMILKFVFTSSGASTPEMFSFAVRAFPFTEDVILELPINVSDRIEIPNRRPLNVKGWGNSIFTELLGLQGESVVAEIFRPPFTVRGVIENVEQPVQYLPELGSPALYSNVRIRGRLGTSSTSGSPPTGPGALGYGTLGINKLGV